MKLATGLKRFPSFSELTEDDLYGLGSSLQLRSYLPRQQIFASGEQAKGMFLVDSGKIKVFRVSLSGVEQVLGVFSPGDEFAVAPMFHGGVYPASAEAIVSSKLYFLEREVLLRQIHDTPELALRLLASMSKKLQGVISLVDSLSLRDAKGRLARYLVRLIDKQPAATLAVQLPMSKTLLAQHLGLKVETVSRTFRTLVEEGALLSSERGRVEIADLSALYLAAGDELEA